MVKAFICGVEGAVLSGAERSFLEREQPYGVILFARNILNPAQLRALVQSLKKVMGHPFANILIDQEGGRVARLRPPPLAGLSTRAGASKAPRCRPCSVCECADDSRRVAGGGYHDRLRPDGGCAGA